MTKEAQPLVETLSRVALELRDLAEAAGLLHCIIEQVDWRSVAEKNAFLRSAQAIDHIEQRLGGLSSFVSALADLTPRDLKVEGHLASREVKVSDLAARLCNAQPAAPSGIQHVAGEPEFF